MKEQGIEPHVTVLGKGESDDEAFSRSDFIYEHEKAIYLYPAGKVLKVSGCRGPQLTCQVLM